MSSFAHINFEEKTNKWQAHRRALMMRAMKRISLIFDPSRKDFNITSMKSMDGRIARIWSWNVFSAIYPWKISRVVRKFASTGTTSSTPTTEFIAILCTKIMSSREGENGLLWLYDTQVTVCREIMHKLDNFGLETVEIRQCFVEEISSDEKSTKWANVNVLGL